MAENKMGETPTFGVGIIGCGNSSKIYRKNLKLPRIEIYGSDGSILAPDPNWFGGDIFLRGENDDEWRQIPIEFPYTANMRGLGVADMARAIRENRPHRASGEMTYHVVDVMRTLLKSAEEGKQVKLKSECERPALLGLDAAASSNTADLAHGIKLDAMSEKAA